MSLPILRKKPAHPTGFSEGTDTRRRLRAKVCANPCSVLPLGFLRRSDAVCSILRASLVLLFLASAGPAHAQFDDLIQREADQARERSVWLLGPLHLTPLVRAGFGYDSNAFLSPDSPNPDVNASAAPGLQVVVPIRNRALVSLYEEVNFVYYRDLQELRDVNNVTRIGGAFGGKNLMVRMDNEFRDEKVRPTLELDVPVDQRSNLLSGALSMSLGWRHELSFEYERYRVNIRDSDLMVGGVPVKSLLDRVEDSYGVRLTRHLSTETVTFLEGYYQTQDFDDKSVERDAKDYGGFVGFVFSPTGNVRGQAQLGYKWIIPDSPIHPVFSGLFGLVDVKVGLGQRFALEGLYARDTYPSVVTESLFFVSNRYGAFLDIYLGSSFFVRPGVVLGRNDYPSDDANSQGELKEPVIRRYNVCSLSFNYHLTPTWLVSIGGSYLNRELNPPFYEKDRFLVNIGFRTMF